MALTSDQQAQLVALQQQASDIQTTMQPNTEAALLIRSMIGAGTLIDGLTGQSVREGVLTGDRYVAMVGALSDTEAAAVLNSYADVISARNTPLQAQLDSVNQQITAILASA